MPRDMTRTGSAMLAAAVLGLLSGLVVAAYFSLAGEPRIREAIAIEQANLAATGQSEVLDPTAMEVSRPAQSGVGLFSALALAGAGFGAVFGLVFASLRSQPDPFRRALLAGLLLATATTVVPWLKYPPNPPAVGDPETLNQRSLLYVLLIALTGIVLTVAVNVGARLREQAVPEPERWTVVAALVLVPLAVVLAILPPNPDAIAVSAKLVWKFREVSLVGNVARWLLLSFGFGLLASRPAAEPTDRRAAALVA